MLNNLEKVDDEGRRASLLDTLCSVDDVLGLPVHPDPPSIANGQLKVNLLRHQVQFSVTQLSLRGLIGSAESGPPVVC